MTTVQASVFGEIGALQEVFLEAKMRRPSRHPAHVLVVEDDPITRYVVKGALGEANAMIIEENARSAVASYLMHAPDIVFLDIALPDVSGFTVLDQIMVLDPDAYVVMFSSHTAAAYVDRAMASGAKGFVAKPFKKETLRNYIQVGSAHHHKS